MQPRLNLKAAQGATNMVSFKDFAPIANSVLNRIINTILTVYGSKAMTVMLVPEIKGNETIANIYTSDGINILKSMEFVNPLETHIADYVRYVADRVEKKSGDGSSTAILLTCKMMKMILSKRLNFAKNNNVNDLLIESSLLEQEIVQFLDETIEFVSKLVIDLDKVNDDFKRRFIKKLCMITSKGDEKLSDILSDMFLYLPKTLRGTSIYDRNPMETPEKYTLFTPENDIYLRVYTSKRAIKNANLNTKIKHNKADVLLFPELPDDPQIILDFIEKRNSPNHLVVVTASANSAVDNLIEGKVDHKKVTLCSRTATSQLHLNNPVDITTVLAMANKQWDGTITLETMEKDLCIYDVRIVIENNELSIFDLYESVNGLHPLFTDRSSEFYNGHEEELRNEIEDLMNQTVKTNDSVQNLKVFLGLYRKLTCYKMPRIMVGGTTTEHFHALDVVADVTSAVSDTLDNGVVFDLLPKLSAHMRRYGYIDIADLITVSYQLGANEKELRAIPDELEVTDLLYFDIGTDSWETFRDGKEPTVVQSYNSIKTTMERIKEAVVPLTKVDAVIVANSVYAEENK